MAIDLLSIIITVLLYSELTFWGTGLNINGMLRIRRSMTSVDGCTRETDHRSPLDDPDISGKICTA